MVLYIFALGGSKYLNKKAREAWPSPSEAWLSPAKSTLWGFENAECKWGWYQRRKKEKQRNKKREKNKSQILRIVWGPEATKQTP